MRRAVGAVVLALGSFLVVAAILLPTYVAGNLVKTPLDQYTVSVATSDNATVFDVASLTVQENVELPLLYKGVKPHIRTELAKAALERVGLADRGKKFPSQLSGGQQQRVSIARALAGDPPLILADEPTGALDSKTGREVLEFLKQLNREGTSIVLITHDNSIAEEIKRVVRIQDGKIISDVVKEGAYEH